MRGSNTNKIVGIPRAAAQGPRLGYGPQVYNPQKKVTHWVAFLTQNAKRKTQNPKRKRSYLGTGIVNLWIFWATFNFFKALAAASASLSEENGPTQTSYFPFSLRMIPG